MTDVQRWQFEIEKNNQLIETTLKQIVVLQNMISATQQNEAVLQVSPEIEKKRN